MNSPPQAANSLVVHVVSARNLHIRGHKPLDAHVSLSTSGKGPWKSKVTTNPVQVEPGFNGETRWDEHCEFQLNETDSKLVVHVNHKTLLGTTETLGELTMPLDAMARFQPAAWFRLHKAGASDQDRGQIQLSYKLARNKLVHSVSNMSLNKIEKEKKFDRLKRKMQQLGRSKRATATPIGDDSQSLASISIAAGASRRSSISSNNSAALAFSSPSPHPTAEEDKESMLSYGRATVDVPMNALNSASQSTLKATGGSGSGKSFADVVVSARSARRGGGAQQQPFAGEPARRQMSALMQSTSGEEPTTPVMNSTNGIGAPPNLLLRPDAAATTTIDYDRTSIGGRSSVSVASSALGGASNTSNGNGGGAHQGEQSSRNLKTKMRQKAEQLLQLRGTVMSGRKHHGQQQQNSDQPHLTIDDFDEQRTRRQLASSRRDSIASSSGIASLGSGQLGALNADTSPEHLLNVIKHLRKELLQKEQRIRDLEAYTDKLVTKVMITNPELLQAASK